jgi:hypothetical protein
MTHPMQSSGVCVGANRDQGCRAASFVCSVVTQSALALGSIRFILHSGPRLDLQAIPITPFPRRLLTLPSIYSVESKISVVLSYRFFESGEGCCALVRRLFN